MLEISTPTSTEHRVGSSVRVEVGITSGVPADSHRSFDVLSSVVLLWEGAGSQVLWT